MEILQSRLPFAPWVDPRHRRLPGIRPLDPATWLVPDDAYAAQMAERERLLAAVPEKVVAALPEAAPAVAELFDRVLEALAQVPGFEVGPQAARRPDGAVVPLDRAAPLATLGRLVQQDLCLMERRGAEHALTAAVLCFPAGWTLAEKLGRPLVAIHRPVPEYHGDLAPRVQRLFDAIRPEAPLWRVNVLAYATPDLFAPHTEAAPRPKLPGRGRYIRSERQCLVKLPATGAVVFSIHTAVVARTALSPAEAAAFAEMHPDA